MNRRLKPRELVIDNHDRIGIVVEQTRKPSRKWIMEQIDASVPGRRRLHVVEGDAPGRRLVIVPSRRLVISARRRRRTPLQAWLEGTQLALRRF